MTNEELIASVRQRGQLAEELSELLADALEAEIARRKSAETALMAYHDAVIIPDTTQAIRLSKIHFTRYPKDSA